MYLTSMFRLSPLSFPSSLEIKQQQQQEQTDAELFYSLAAPFCIPTSNAGELQVLVSTWYHRFCSLSHSLGLQCSFLLLISFLLIICLLILDPVQGAVVPSYTLLESYVMGDTIPGFSMTCPLVASHMPILCSKLTKFLEIGAFAHACHHCLMTPRGVRGRRQWRTFS